MNRETSPPHILITGGSGLVGKALTEALLKKEYQVSHLSRKPGNNPKIKTFLWDVGQNKIDPNCINGVDIIIHLAGAGIADKRWTDKRKKEIIDSRTKSIGLIYEVIKSENNKVSTVISASATGYYSDRGDELLSEESQPGADFLGECCVAWEQAVDEGKSLSLRVVKFRTGVVLNKKGGALPPMAKPVKFGLGAAFGNGRQWIPWIHWQDIVDMYVYSIENIHLTGVYNMAAPNPATNKQLIKAIAKQLFRPLWPIKVPSLVFKLLFGEMSVVILGSTKVSSKKIESEGYVFKYPELKGALKNIYGS